MDEVATGDWAQIVMTAFAISNAGRILAYAPQLLCILRDRAGAASISILTWSLFMVSHLTTVAYAGLVLGDRVMALLFVGNALACGAIVALTLVKRGRFARAGAPRPPASPMLWSPNRGETS